MCMTLWSVSVRSIFFFFKQKTAYEMRISDWSSDVCSSDLATDLVPVNLVGAVQQPHRSRVREHLAQQEVVRETRTAEGLDSPEIGRASCRERVCQYV